MHGGSRGATGSDSSTQRVRLYMCVCVSRAYSLTEEAVPAPSPLLRYPNLTRRAGGIRTDRSAALVRVDATPQRRVEKHEPPVGFPHLPHVRVQLSARETHGSCGFSGFSPVDHFVLFRK